MIEHKDIDPYNEEIWDEELEYNWCVKKNSFPKIRGISFVWKKNLTKDSAKNFSEFLNLVYSDEYTNYSYEQIK